MILEISQRKVYTVILKYGKRSYLTAQAAARRAAREKITEKYPTVKPYYSSGRLEDPGFHWRSCISRSDVLYRRLARIYLKQIRSIE